MEKYFILTVETKYGKWGGDNTVLETYEIPYTKEGRQLPLDKAHEVIKKYADCDYEVWAYADFYSYDERGRKYKKDVFSLNNKGFYKNYYFEGYKVYIDDSKQLKHNKMKRVKDNWLETPSVDNFSAIDGFVNRTGGDWNEQDEVGYTFGIYIEDDYSIMTNRYSYPLSSVNDIMDVVDGVITDLNEFIDGFDFDYYVQDMKRNLNGWLRDTGNKPYTDDELRAMVQEGYDYFVGEYDKWVNKIKPWQERVRGTYVNDSRRVKDGLTRSERYNRNMERIFASAERFNQNQMKWLREQGISEDEIQNAKRNTGLHGSKLSELVIQTARANGDTRENSEILGEAMGISDSRRVRPVSRRIKDSVKAKMNVRKRINDAIDKYFRKDLKNLQAYRRVTDAEGKIKEDVVFLIEDGDILAVFPNTYGTADRDKDTMTCYAHVGQHSTCTYDYANTLKTASESEYKELYDELTNYVGYDLNVLKSLPSEAELKQNAKEIRDSYRQHKRHAITDERMLARGEEIEYNGKRGKVQYALFHGQEPVVVRWTSEEGSEEFEIPYNQVKSLKIHDSDDDTDVNIENVDADSNIDGEEVTDGCGKKGKKKVVKDNIKKVKVTKRQTKKTE